MRTVYTLNKYSRAYPTQRNIPQAANTFEWQHHTRPLLQLALITAQTPSGHPQAIRLVIVWSPSSAPVEGQRQRDEVFVIISPFQLFSYWLKLFIAGRFRSNLFSRSCKSTKISKCSTESGISWTYGRIQIFATDECGYSFHGKSLSCIYALSSRWFLAQQEYRRFQINFQSAEAASQLINAIASVCPCKSGGMNDQHRTLAMNQSFYPDQRPGRNEYQGNFPPYQTMQTPIRPAGRQMPVPSTPIHQFHNAHNAHVNSHSPLTPASLASTRMTPSSSYFGPVANAVYPETFSDTQSQRSTYDNDYYRARMSPGPSASALSSSNSTASARIDSGPIANSQQLSTQSKSIPLRVLTPPSSSSDVASCSTSSADKIDSLSTAHNLNSEKNQAGPHGLCVALIDLMRETIDLADISDEDLEELMAIVIREGSFVQLV